MRSLRGPLALALLGCSSPLEPREVSIDCSVGDAYEFQLVQPFETDDPQWFEPFGDGTPGSIQTQALEPIEGGRCESGVAMVIRISGHKDWGAGTGEYGIAMGGGVPATDYEGVSFWARAAGFGTSRGFLLNLGDAHTHPSGGNCDEVDAMDVASGGYTVNEAGMVVPVGGELPGPNDCGNTFTRVVMAERDWHLHLLPFESFQQLAQPNRRPSGIDRTLIYQFTLNFPKDTNLELWLDNLAFYRRRTPENVPQ